MGRSLAPAGQVFQCFISNCGVQNKDKYELSRHFRRQHCEYDRADLPAFFAQLNLVHVDDDKHDETEAKTSPPATPSIISHSHSRSRKRSRDAYPATAVNDDDEYDNNNDDGDGDGHNSNGYDATDDDYHDDLNNDTNAGEICVRSKKRRLTQSGVREDTTSSELLSIVAQTSTNVDLRKNDLPQWVCYICHKRYSRRDSVERHFHTGHRECLEIFQQSRVVRVLYDAVTDKPLRLLKTPYSHRPTLIGLPREIRERIFQELLTPTKHPRRRSFSPCYALLGVPGGIREEAQSVMNRMNFVIRIIVEYQSRSPDNFLERALFDKIKSFIDIPRTEVFIKPALSIKLGIRKASENSHAIKTRTEIVFTYNEKTFAAFVQSLCQQSRFVVFASFQFSPRARNRVYYQNLPGVLRCLNCVREIGRVLIEGLENTNDELALVQTMTTRLDDTPRVFTRLQYLKAEGKCLMEQQMYTQAATVFEIGWNFAHMSQGVQDRLVPGQQDLWVNALKECACLLASEVCRALTLDLATSMPYESNVLQGSNPEAIMATAINWAKRCLEFCGLSDETRGRGHYARACANLQLADIYLHKVETHSQGVEQAYLEVVAFNLFFAAQLLVHQRQNILDELNTIDARRGKKTTSTHAKFQRFNVQGGNIWEGDPRLIKVWGIDQLYVYPELSRRPPGWTLI